MKKLVYIFSAFFVIVGIFLLAQFFSKKQPSTGSNGVIAQVGKESIYQNDLDFETKYAPPMKPDVLKPYLLKKMINDSIVLQAGLSDGFIKELPQEIFNAPNKDYLKRLEAVESIKKAVTAKSTVIKGDIISLWFFNNNTAGKYGYDGGKERAFSLIKTYHENVINNQLTIDKVAQMIKEDSSLEDLDPAYKTNAITHFEIHGAKPITFDKDFDTLLRKTKEGGITNVVGLVTQRDSTQPVEVAYSFAKIITNSTSDISSVEMWQKNAIKRYSVILN